MNKGIVREKIRIMLLMRKEISDCVEENKKKAVNFMPVVRIKEIKKLRFMLFTIAILLFVWWMFSTVSLAETGDVEDANLIVSGDYKYKILEDGTAELCEYSGAGGAITVPARIDGIAVKRLGEDLFNDNMSLTKVVIESGIKELGGKCFYCCENLVSVYMPDSVESMGTFVFLNNIKLKEVRLSQNLTIIPEATFIWCDSLEEIEIPSKVKKIDYIAFTCCIALREVYLPDSVTMLGNEAFSSCTELQRVRISPKTEGISNEAFMNTPNLKWVTTIDWRKLKISNNFSPISLLSEEDCIIICDNVFSNSLINKSIVVGKNINRLGKNVFSPTSVLYGKKGSDVEKYAIANNHVYKEYIPVERICFKTASIPLTWNQKSTIKLSYSVSPVSASITTVGYFSSNPKVATVDGEGNVKALSEGKAVITAVSLDNASRTTSCQVTVTTGLNTFKLSKNTMTIYPGKKNGKQLTVTTSPKKTNGWNVNWRSSNTKVAKVDQKGNVIGIGPGVATITATCSDKKVSCKVIVRPSDLKEFVMKSQTTSSVTFKWKAVTGVTGYKLYGYNSKTKKYQTICYLKGSQNSYTLKQYIDKKKLTSGTRYTVYLKPYKTINKVKYYGKVVKLKVATKPDKVKISSIRRTGTSKNKGWKIQWKKVKGASGYKVYVSTNRGKSYKRISVINNAKRTSYQLKKGKRRTTYYIKISAYKSIGKQVIGGAKSKAKSIRIY